MSDGCCEPTATATTSAVFANIKQNIQNIISNDVFISYEYIEYSILSGFDRNLKTTRRTYNITQLCSDIFVSYFHLKKKYFPEINTILLENYCVAQKTVCNCLIKVVHRYICFVLNGNYWQNDCLNI